MIQFLFFKKNTRIFLTVFFLCSIAVTIPLKSQSLESEVVSVAGETDAAGNEMFLSWTLGESVIESYSDGSLILVQGYHQPTMKAIPIISVSGFKDVISVYPNPATEFISIALQKNSSVVMPRKVRAELRDLTGRLIREAEFEGLEHKMDVHLIANGMYLLRLMNAEDKTLIGSFAIEKLK